jgi:exodeoxyribonuclease VII small subunit
MTKKEIGLGRLEKSLQELEALVEHLESGELPLEKALAEFERGMKITKECQAVLKDAEQKIQILLKQDEQAAPEPFEAGDEDVD